MKKLMIFVSVLGCGNLMASGEDANRRALLISNGSSLHARYRANEYNSAIKRAREKRAQRGDYLICDPRPFLVLNEELLNNNEPLYPTK